MQEGGILLGIDFGTGGCKVSAVSVDGSLLADASVEYATEYPKPGWSEQKPSDWYPAMCKALAKISGKGVDLSKAICAAFDGSTHNAVLLDEKMAPVRKTIMWTDQRSVKECEYLRKFYGGEIFSETFQMPAPTWTLPQLMWIKSNEPEVLQKAKRVLFVKDYVRYLVTGVAATDYIEAQGTLFFDMKKMRWSRDLFALSGLDFSALPELVKPSDIVGKVSRQASLDTGIPEGTPVVCGASDSAVEDYGAGAIEPGDCILKLATAGNVNIMTSSPRPSGTTLTYSHIIGGMWYAVSATNAAALCQRWFRDAFCAEEKNAALALKRNAFDIMDALAGNSPAGAGGVFFHPYLQGERSPYWDPDLRASFTGVSISSTKGDFARAILEGVAFSLRDCYGSLESAGLKARRFFLIGGGARSSLWSSIISNVFNSTVLVPTPGDASYGAALLAGVGSGVFSAPGDAVRKCLKIVSRAEPDSEESEFYSKQFEKYKAVHDALAPVYKNKNL